MSWAARGTNGLKRIAMRSQALSMQRTLAETALHAQCSRCLFFLDLFSRNGSFLRSLELAFAWRRAGRQLVRENNERTPRMGTGYSHYGRHIERKFCYADEAHVGLALGK
jgi:hypothetical protein